MKKIFLIISLFFLFTSYFSVNKVLAACIPFGRSCDVTNVCCNFPSVTCQGGTTGGYCKDTGTQCGKIDVQCCSGPNPKCSVGLTCDNNHCVAVGCGGSGQDCCSSSPRCSTPGESCLPTGKCGIPAPCGGHQEQCCTTDPVCKVSGETCQSNGRCDVSAPTCGGYREACCTPPQQQCTRPGDYCNLGGICTYSGTCGSRNGFCCPVSPICAIPGDSCDASGHCTGTGPICGGHGMTCCSGSPKCTTPGDTCNNGTCGVLTPCGGHKQPCCQTGQACTYGGDSCQANGLCDNYGGGGSSGVKPAPCPPGQPVGIMTALGCIPTENSNEFAAWFLKLALGIGGGLAFLLIIFGTLKIITAGGSPDGIKNGSEIITSALMGLFFIIFSVFLLHLIGVDILQIPGFKK